MSWTFETSTGGFYQPDSSLIAHGYSGGNCGKNPEWVNNSESEQNHGATIPQGLYHRGVLVPHSQLGVDAIQLVPDQSTVLYGRSGFYVHGDNQDCNKSASEGCIILPHDIRMQFLSSNDADLEVVAVKIG
jgi:hypothetical protein